MTIAASKAPDFPIVYVRRIQILRVSDIITSIGNVIDRNGITSVQCFKNGRITYKWHI